MPFVGLVMRAQFALGVGRLLLVMMERHHQDHRQNHRQQPGGDRRTSALHSLHIGLQSYEKNQICPSNELALLPKDPGSARHNLYNTEKQSVIFVLVLTLPKNTGGQHTSVLIPPFF